MSFDFSKQTIGILGGMGPAATAQFLRYLIAEVNNLGVVEDGKFPKIIMLSIPLSGWNNTGATNKAAVASQVRQGVNWLETFGANLIAIPCNSVHEFIDSARVVNIIHATLARCKEAKVIGVLCSRQARDSALYEQLEGKRYVYISDQVAIDRIIARVLTGQKPDISEQISELYGAGADKVVLGCTELSLCEHIGFSRLVDSCRVLAGAVTERLIEG